MPVSAGKLSLAFTLLVGICLFDLYRKDDLSFGRAPWRNLLKTASQMLPPSFVDAIGGETYREFRSDDGTLLRTDNPRVNEQQFLQALLRALWITFIIATLGTAISIAIAVPLSFGLAANVNKATWLRVICQAFANLGRSTHTLVFGLIFVGIIGLGPTAGILAVAAHGFGSMAKLFAESIESLDPAPIDAIRSVGASPPQVFFFGVVPMVLPQFISTILYIWEFNARDSTILGIVGAGGIGLLLSEAISLFQWDRLATLILVIAIFVTAFDSVSRYLRSKMI